MPINSVHAPRNRFNPALSDGPPTPSEPRGLSQPLRLHADRFEPTVGFSDLPDPALMNRHGGEDWSRVDGALFVDGARFDDALQGADIANCYLVASLSEIALQDPVAIGNTVRDNGDGSFSVRLFEDSGSGDWSEVEITVDGDLPGRSGELYGHSATREELWVGLIEKAFAQWKGGYEAIGNGGSPGEVMSAVLGRPHGFTWSEGNAPDALYTELQIALSQGQSAVAGTYGEDQAGLYTGTGLYPWHSYSVLGVGEQVGERFVELRNPWGYGEPDHDGVDDGVFRLHIEDYARMFVGHWIC